MEDGDEMNNIILFYGSNSEYKEFSNWYVRDFKVENKVFHSGEQWFMYAKAMLFGDEDIAEAILRTDIKFHKDNAIVKRYGREVSNFDNKIWDKYKEDLIYKGLLQKFKQNEDLMKLLLFTGNAIIAEASPKDCIWGIGLDINDSDAYDMSKWKGQNCLGKVLMRVRDTLSKC